ncbi:hypothetical protein N0V84_000846 [Fusarium piperis]|uniref:Uncharacterized protein n=1 Tax=Fusarium piperis TaxID=1435070 RepID=A0A9W9BUT6_9HYPO|nr:hypothetical protein N0V84_000846 [Fusarium piperis]
MLATPVSGNNEARGPSIASTALSADENRTVTFADVFRNGNAPVKRLIIQYPPDYGKWYIIRCWRHNVNFKENPLKAASRHICQSKHPNKPRDYESVIKMMGYEVLNCDEVLAEQNNTIARETFGTRRQPRAADSIEVGYQTIAAVPEVPVSDDDDDYQEEGSDKFTLKISNSTRRRRFMVITDPTPGEVYQVYWRVLKKWTAALILPLENLDKVGVPESIEDLGLLKSLPPCYTYDSTAKTIRWSKGYEAGGKFISKREFPVMFFNGVPFSDRSEVAWVPSKDLQPPEICALEPDIQGQVLDYLKSRRAEEERVAEAAPEERSIEAELEERGIQGELKRMDPVGEKSPHPTVHQDGSFQPSDQTVPMAEEAAETSQPAQVAESRPIVPIVIDLTGEDSSSDEESVAGKDTAMNQEQPADSAVNESVVEEELVVAANEPQGEPKDGDSGIGMATIPSTDSTITEPPTPTPDKEAQLLVPGQQDVPGLQPTPSKTVSGLSFR